MSTAFAAHLRGPSAPRRRLLRLVLASLAPGLLVPAAQAQIFDRASTPSDPTLLGRQAAAWSDTWPGPMLSADGRIAAFNSVAQNLHPDDRNPGSDLFVVDIDSGAVRLVGPALTDPMAAGDSHGGALSADGRVVLFNSSRRDLVAGVDTGRSQPYVFELDTGAVEAVAPTFDGSPLAAWTDGHSLSADGRYVGFESGSDRMVSGDGNGRQDAFVRDRSLATTTRISLAFDGSELAADAGGIALSGDGRRACFTTAAAGVVAGIGNGRRQVYLRDLDSGHSVLASRTASGAPGNHDSDTCRLSADGSAVLFQSRASDLVTGDSNGVTDLFVFDVATATVERVNVGDGGEQSGAAVTDAAISADGRRIAFQTAASEMPDSAAGRTGLFVRDRDAQRTRRIDRAVSGAVPDGDPTISPSFDAGARRVLFASSASTLVDDDDNRADDVFIVDLDADDAVVATRRISLAQSPLPAGGGGTQPSTSADGRYTAFVSDALTLARDTGIASTSAQIYVFDRHTRAIELISRGVDGDGADRSCSQPRIDGAGRHVVYLCAATNLAGTANGLQQVFLHDRVDGHTLRVSTAGDGAPASGMNIAPVISADGSRVAFGSMAGNLVDGDVGKILLWRREDGQLVRVDTSAGGHPVGAVAALDLSADGRALLLITSGALHPDANGQPQVFVKDLSSGAVTLVSRGSDGAAGNAASTSARMSADGKVVVFVSLASNLVDGDVAGSEDLFVAELDGGTLQRVPADGISGPYFLGGVSDDGRHLAFSAIGQRPRLDGAGHFRDGFVHDRISARSRNAGRDRHGRGVPADVHQLALSGDGLIAALRLGVGAAIDIPGRPAAPDQGWDVVLAHTPHGPLIMRDGFEP